MAKLSLILIPFIAVAAWLGWLFYTKKAENSKKNYKFWNLVFFGAMVFMAIFIIAAKDTLEIL